VHAASAPVGAARPRLERALFLFSHRSGKPKELRLVVVRGDDNLLHLAVLNHDARPRLRTHFPEARCHLHGLSAPRTP